MVRIVFQKRAFSNFAKETVPIPELMTSRARQGKALSGLTLQIKLNAPASARRPYRSQL
jgi:hypothetical protein